MNGLKTKLFVILLLAMATACTRSGSDTATEDLIRQVEQQQVQLVAHAERLDDLTLELTELQAKRRTKQAERRSRLDFTGGRHPGKIVTVYYWLYEDDYEILQPVEVLVPRDTDDLTAAVEAWVAGDPESGLSGGLGTYPLLLSAFVEDGVAILDFDERLTGAYSGSAWAYFLEFTLVYTATELPGIESVLVRREGEVPLFHGGFWDEPRQRIELYQTMKLGELIRYSGPGRPLP